MNYYELRNCQNMRGLSFPRKRESSRDKHFPLGLDISVAPSAFTLIEILIIVAIVGIMATVSVVNFQAGREDEALRLDALRIANALRTAQNYAQTGIHQSYASAQAYGVYVKKPGTVLVFADTSCPKDGTNACLPDTTGKWEDGQDTKIQDVSLAIGERKSIALDAAAGIAVDGANRDEVHIGFRALTASGLIDGKSEGGIVTITLKSSRNQHTKKVTINRLTGRVDAEY